MKNKLVCIITLLVLVSCNDTVNNDVYKTKDGEYASRSGNFVADFPTQPKYTTIDNQIGLDKFKIHLYRSALGAQKIFSIEYVDYPEHFIASMDNEQLYAQSVNNFANKMRGSFMLVLNENIEQHSLKGKAFQLEASKEIKNQGLNAFIMGRLFRKDNRVYTITYTGVDDKHVDSFLNSFRLLNY